VGTNPVEWCQAEVSARGAAGFLLAHLQTADSSAGRAFTTAEFPEEFAP